LSVRQVWKIGQDYRFEFRQARDRTDSLDLPEA